MRCTDNYARESIYKIYNNKNKHNELKHNEDKNKLDITYESQKL